MNHNLLCEGLHKFLFVCRALNGLFCFDLTVLGINVIEYVFDF